MKRPTIPRNLATTAICLAANTMVPLQAAESLSFLRTDAAVDLLGFAKLLVTMTHNK
ncbi:MAG: hypothetical protein IKJ58_10565 [Akkermansia sp.]|nr:hypothetical protein [Akkermansia sp.]